MNEYAKRTASLKRLGFNDYRGYLSSDLWASIRESVFRKKGRRCLGCGKTATQVHHKSYSFAAMAGKDMTKLAPVCGRCHKSIEFDGARKSTVPEANDNLRAVGGVAVVIDEMQTTAGGWTRESLEQLGIPWPPPKGWKKRLTARCSSGHRLN